MGRVSDTGKGRNTAQRNVKTKYFFFYEGAKTEPNYFEFIKCKAEKNDEHIKLSSLVEPVSMMKFGPYYNVSDINELIKMADTYRSDIIRRKYNLDYFVSVVMHPVTKVYSRKYGDEKDSNEIAEVLFSRHSAIINGLMRKDFRYRNKVVNPNDYDDLLKKTIDAVISSFDEIFKDENSGLTAKEYREKFTEAPYKRGEIKINCTKKEISHFIKTGEMPLYSEGDIFVVVHDRDYDEDFFPDEKYQSALKEAAEKDIKLAISTPMFEYWLLLHHEETYDIPFDKSKESKFKVQGILDCLEGRRSKDDFDKDWKQKHAPADKNALKTEQKNIGDERFDKYYLEGFQRAIDRSLEGVTDNELLMNQGGTSLGLIFKKMIS